MQEEELIDAEVDLLLNDVLEIYGYDFTNYSRASVKRRISRLLTLDRFVSFADFYDKVLHDDVYLTRFVEELTINVTEMFRDPAFYQSLREEVLPALATCPLIRVWHAGCSTGEEVYSVAILLKEAGLAGKSLQYATDINPSVLKQVKNGIYSLSAMKQYSENYINSGGKRDFSSYYTAKYDLAKFNDTLKTRIIVSTHNLVSDRSFNEFQLIVCRNVLIYFDKHLQDRVLRLFDSSLEKRGFLALGAKETVKYSEVADSYEQVNGHQKIWRKLI